MNSNFFWLLWSCCALFRVTSKMKQKVANGARKVWSTKSQRARERDREREINPTRTTQQIVSFASLCASFASYIIVYLMRGEWGACMCALNIKGRALIIFYGPTSGRPAGSPCEYDHVRDRWHSFKAHLSQVRSLPSFVFNVFLFFLFLFHFPLLAMTFNLRFENHLTLFTFTPLKLMSKCQGVIIKMRVFVA